MDYFNFIHIVRLPSLLQPGMSNKSAVFEDEEKKLSQTQSKNKFQSEILQIAKSTQEFGGSDDDD